MSAAAQPKPSPAPVKTEKPPEDQNKKLLDSILDREIEYEPFLAKPGDTIKLSARLVLKYLCRPTKSGQKCTDDQAVRFMMLCKARGLNPWEGDAFLIGYDTDDGPEFSLVTAHQAFLKRAEVHPDFEGMESGIIVANKDGTVSELPGAYRTEEQILVGGWARIHMKGRKVPIYKSLRLAAYNKGRSRWKVDPESMILKCAESACTRSAMPNHLGGMYAEEEFSPFDDHEPKKPEPLPVGKMDLRAPKNGKQTAPVAPSPAPVVQEEPTPEAPAPVVTPPEDPPNQEAPEPPKEVSRDDAMARLDETIAECRTAEVLDSKGKVLGGLLKEYGVRSVGSLSTEQAVALDRKLQIELDAKRAEAKEEEQPPSGEKLFDDHDPREAQR